MKKKLKFMKQGFLILILSLIVKFSFGQDFPALKGDYLGQTPPGDTAVMFAPGIISLPNRLEYKIAFSPDGNEIYFHFANGNYSKIYSTKRINNTWTEPEEAPFSVNQNFFNPVFSANGKKLYIAKSNNDNSNCDIWMVDRTTGAWSKPQLLPEPINSTSDENICTETADSILYISSNRSGNWDIWCIRRLTDKTLQAENLGPIVNSTEMDLTPCIAHDGSYLIFSSTRPGGYGNQDLYICFNKGNSSWTVPVNMERSGAKINIAHYAHFGPTLSPDGKYLFFTRHNGAGDKLDIYWVSTKVIDEIRKEVFNPKVSK
jgi:Tol biopolymer transport system component